MNEVRLPEHLKRFLFLFVCSLINNKHFIYTCKCFLIQLCCFFNRIEQQSFKLSGSKQKFKAVYQFDARNPDELSLNPGDTVMVSISNP